MPLARTSTVTTAPAGECWIAFSIRFFSSTNTAPRSARRGASASATRRSRCTLPRSASRCRKATASPATPPRSSLRHLEVARLADLGQVQQLVHLARHAVDVAQQQLAVGRLAQFDLAADQRERRLQLVRGRREEFLLHAIALLQPVERLVERADQRPHLARHRGLGQPRLEVARRDARRGLRRAPQRQQEVAQRAVHAEGEQQQRHRGDQQRVLQDRADDRAAEQRGRAIADRGLHEVAVAVVRQRLRDDVQRQAVDDDVEALARRVEAGGRRRERRRAGIRRQQRHAARVDDAVLPVVRRGRVDPGRVGRLAQRHRRAGGVEDEVRLDPVDLLAEAVRQRGERCQLNAVSSTSAASRMLSKDATMNIASRLPPRLPPW
jgi:hypothetical protein